jgi:hypothetical protein
MTAEIYYGTLIRKPDVKRRKRRKRNQNDRPTHRALRLHDWLRKQGEPLDRQFEFRK